MMKYLGGYIATFFSIFLFFGIAFRGKGFGYIVPDIVNTLFRGGDTLNGAAFSVGLGLSIIGTYLFDRIARTIDKRSQPEEKSEPENLPDIDPSKLNPVQPPQPVYEFVPVAPQAWSNGPVINLGQQPQQTQLYERRVVNGYNQSPQDPPKTEEHTLLNEAFLGGDIEAIKG